MKKENITSILIMIIILLITFLFTTAITVDVEKHDVVTEHEITMKWKVPRLLSDLDYYFELDNSTEYEVDHYDYYKYDEGDIYVIVRTEYVHYWFWESR